MAAATFKVAVLDADVVAVVTVAAIRVALVTKDVVDADTTVGAKVCTTKETKAPTTKATRTLATKAVGAGPTTAGPTTCLIFHRYIQPGSQNAQSFHNLPVPGTVMVPMQMVCGTQASSNNQQDGRNVHNGQSSVGMGSSYSNFRG